MYNYNTEWNDASSCSYIIGQEGKVGARGEKEREKKQGERVCTMEKATCAFCNTAKLQGKGQVAPFPAAF